jgi:sec-independent protein translocase protein TatC
VASSALRRPIGHEDRLSLVEHLDELRTRLIISVIALVVAFGLCLWQNGPLLNIINHPLEVQTQANVKKGRGPLGQTYLAQQAVRGVARELDATMRALAAPTSKLPAGTRAALLAQRAQLRTALAQLPKTPPGNKPVTLGVGEPFANTLLVSLYFALLLAMPVILWQLYGFVLPAFSPAEKRIALPLLLMIPGLFLVGVAFGYFLVLPAAVRFLQTFNADNFNILVQAKDYYRFAALCLVAMGIVFQVPVGILALTRFGVVKLETLRKNRRYAFVGAFVVATPLPGTDPVSMILESLMLYALYEVGIVISRLLGRAHARAVDSDDEAELEPTSL